MDLNLKALRAKGHEALQNNYWRSCFLTGLMLVLSYATVFTALTDFIKEAPTAVHDTYVNLTTQENLDVQVVAMMVTLIFGVLLLTTIIKIVVSIFVKNPTEVGVRLFMKHSQNPEKGGMIADVAYCFDHMYMRAVKCMVITQIVEYLWGILLIIPGVVKAYQYRMVPYLLPDHQDMSPKEVMALSKKMMDGYKMKAFLLDLSFIPWHIAGFLLLGILEIFFVVPYKYQTDAAFYEEIKARYDAKEKQN